MSVEKIPLVSHFLQRSINAVGMMGSDSQRFMFGFSPELIHRLGPGKDAFAHSLSQLLIDSWTLDHATTNKPNTVKARTALSPEYSLGKGVLDDILFRPWETTVNEEGKEKKTWNIPEAVEYSAQQKNVVIFLGLPDEATFLDVVPQNIEEMIGETIFTTDSDKNIDHQSAVKSRFRASLEFATKAYQQREKPLRKSGESYICHPMRVLHYTLSRLKKMGRLPQSAEDWNDVIDLSLLHDVLEDVESIRCVEENTSPLTKYRSDSVHNADRSFSLSHPEISSSIQISQRTLDAIHAVSFEEVEVDKAKFLHTSRSSKWEMAEIVKNCDRLDNILTYPIGAAKNWGRMAYKMLEGAAGTAHLSWSSLYNHANRDNLGNLLDLLKQNSSEQWRNSFPEFLCCLGLYQSSMSNIHREWLNRMWMDHRIHLGMTSQEKIQHGYRDGWKDVDEVSSTLDIRHTLDSAAERIQIQKGLFGMEDIDEYNKEVWIHWFGRVQDGLPKVGFGKYPFWRPRDKEDAVIDRRHTHMALASATARTAWTVGVPLGAGTVFAAMADPSKAHEFTPLLFASEAALSVGLSCLLDMSILRNKQRRSASLRTQTLRQSIKESASSPPELQNSL